jgi:8-oxo-dGTP pyrophosphatase MutT (NUDIX family)
MTEISVPSQASTIIIVRPQKTDGFEVLLTRRPQEMEVLGGYLVFPGGRVEEGDWSEKMIARCRGLSVTEAKRILDGPMRAEMCLGYWVAAVRELFEEAGIHFFVNDGETAGGLSESSQHRLAQQRRALSQGRISLSDLLESERLFCDLSGLTYLFHRITPEKHKTRFDTRFYLAALPAGQRPLASSEEVAESLWLAPDVALNSAESGKFPMMPPTLIALRTLADIGTWQGLSSLYRLA